jgi:3',5'-cyclic AMP phosphodiesterase CpdA
MTVASSIDLTEPLAEQTKVVRAVILSDIHATAEGKPETNVNASATGPEKNALDGARAKLLQELDGTGADIVLCPGDLVNGGKPEPIEWVWEQLLGLASDLGATLIGAAGNHDLLRKPTLGRWPFDPLRALEPPFPIGDKAQVNSYWANDFGVERGENWRLVTMNSCALHGGFNEQESDVGRFRKNCLNELAKSLENTQETAARVNICMIHHHPVEWTHGGDRPASHLQHGDLLIDLLDRRPERWIVVSGHKHYPALGYLGYGTNGPVWLAAGSIGADLLRDTGTRVRNQMHVVDIALDATATVGLAVAGEIRSFDWQPGFGWTDALASSGLPARCGFGYRRDSLELVNELRSCLARAKRSSIRWAELVREDPRWHFLTPTDRRVFLDAVRTAGGGVTGGDETFEMTLP